MDSTIIPSFSREFIDIKYCFNILIHMYKSETFSAYECNFKRAFPLRSGSSLIGTPVVSSYNCASKPQE